MAIFLRARARSNGRMLAWSRYANRDGHLHALRVPLEDDGRESHRPTGCEELCIHVRQALHEMTVAEAAVQVDDAARERETTDLHGEGFLRERDLGRANDR